MKARRILEQVPAAMMTPEQLVESSPRYKLLWEAWKASRIAEPDIGSTSGASFIEWFKKNVWHTDVRSESSPLDVLTFRQREVADLLVLGKDHHEIAAAIGISSKTVDTRRLHLLKRLGVRNNVELVRLALGAPVGGHP